MAKESSQEALIRWKKLELLQSHYSSFNVFLEEAMSHLGFGVTEIQADIGNFLQYGPHYLMIQAQRSQAKTTITACFAVWALIHEPRARVLIVSAGGTQANEISTLIVRLILSMDELECMRPDKMNGDRTSVEAFDVHYTLKGVDKSPSVACAGVTANLQGKRADILIADDVESAKNSQTATMREQLLNLTRDFISICQSGRIIYLGTPQTMESIYNTLPARGFNVRIWPGRYPSPEQMDNYGDMLAPLIARRLTLDPALGNGGGYLGDQGQPTDPELLDEDKLQQKERDQGPSYFQLQHMLNTRMLDAMRYPLKTKDLVVMRLTRAALPMAVVRGFGNSSLHSYQSAGFNFQMSAPHTLSEELAPLQGVMMYVDPAGGGRNGDETGYAVTGFLNGNIFLLDCGGFPGGYEHTVLEGLAEVAKRWEVNTVKIEKNMGFGAFREVWLPILRKEWECAVEDDYVTGQKELRIIQTLEPVIARGSLIVNEEIALGEDATLNKYPINQKQTFSLFFQIARLSRERGALVHDDRLDAVEGAVRHWQALLAIDQQKAVEAQKQAELAKFLKDPLHHNRFSTKGPSLSNSLLTKRYR